MTSIEQNAKRHEENAKQFFADAAEPDSADRAETPKAAPAPAIVLDHLSKYVAKALVTKSPGFVRPVLDENGQLPIIAPGEKRKMETYAQGPATDFLHAMTGGLTEIAGEFCDQLKAHLFYGKDLDYVNLGEELGDSWWYIAIALAATDTPLDQVQKLIDESVEAATTVLGENNTGIATPIELLEMATSLSKRWAYLNGVAVSDFQVDSSAKVFLHGHPEAEAAFLAVIGQTAAIGVALGHDYRLVWQSNIAKLAKRYGDKFTPEDAQFRRLDEERALLEANHDANVNADTEAEPMARVNLKTFLEAQDGKFVGIDYVKKDGSDRSLNGRLGVQKHLKGGANNTEALDRSYLTVYDLKAKGYRTVDLSSASRVRANGRIYHITD